MTDTPRPQVHDAMVKVVVMAPDFVYTDQHIKAEGFDNLLHYVSEGVARDNEVVVCHEVLMVSAPRDITDEEAAEMSIDLTAWTPEPEADEEEPA
jgi:hypothetical protein